MLHLSRSSLAVILLSLLFDLATPKSNDDWNTKAYPVEEFTSGLEVNDCAYLSPRNARTKRAHHIVVSKDLCQQSGVT